MAANTDAMSETSSSVDKSEARCRGAHERRGIGHKQPAPLEPAQSVPDIQEKIKEFRRKDILSIFVFAAISLAVVAGFSGWIWIEIQHQSLIEQQLAPPPNWDEQQYLSKNPDFAEAVRRGRFKSGWEHYAFLGVEEKRRGVSIERLATE